MKKKVFFVTALFGALSINVSQAQTPLAFPGAEGFGRYALGARGVTSPTIYHVTNLNDSGSGSLRDAVSQSGRIVVFDVAGVIKIKDRIVFSPDLYVAGQTAPGMGITVYGNGVTFSAANNVIVRYIRFRMGTSGTSGKDAAGLANGKDMIFDHLSCSWGLDETFSINWDSKGTEPDNITIQNSIIGQGLLTHSCGGLVQTNGGVTLFRNLYIDNKTRNPKVKGLNQYINNIVYNWGSGGCYIMGGDSEGITWADVENNYFIKGPTGSTNAFVRGNDNFQIYQKGSMTDYNLDGILNGDSATVEDIPATNVADLNSFIGSVSTKTFPAIVQEMSAEDAYKWAVDSVGTSIPDRDAVDDYMVNQLTSLGTEGSILTNETELGLPNNVGYVFTSTKLLDTDNDGISDAWEDAHGLNKSDASDALAVASNGYLNIENYINSLDKPNVYVRYATNLNVKSITEKSISFNWENNAKAATGIRIESSTDGINYTPIDTISANSTEYTAIGLLASTNYYFRLQTINNELTSSYSDALSSSTKASAQGPEISTDPTPVDKSTISDYSSTTLSWQNPTAATIRYRIYFGTSPDSLVLLNTTYISAKSITVDLNQNTTYYWRVDGRTSLGEQKGTIWSFTSGSMLTHNKVAYWPFDGNITNQSNDDVATTANDYTPTFVTGRINDAINFNGQATAEALVQPNYDEINIGSGPFSVEFWFQSTAPSSDIDWYLIHKGKHTADSSTGALGKWWGLQFQKNSKNDRLTWAIDDNVTKTSLDIEPGSTYFTGNWNHVVCIRDSVNKKIMVYINGVLAGSTTDATGDIAETENLVIGNCNSTYTNAFVGLMDDVTIYDTALTAADIAAKYAAGLATGIHSISDVSNVKAYPIPFVDVINIESSKLTDGEKNVRIYNSSGAIMLDKTVVANNHKIALSSLGSLASGIYVCIISTGQETIACKICK